MNKILYLTITLVLISYFSEAQQDAKAKEILDKASAKMKTFSTYKADFLYIFENQQQKVNDTIKGIISVKGEKYKLEMAGTQRFYNGTDVVTFMTEEKEATISSKSEDDSEINPASIFSIYEKDFKYMYREDMVQNGKKVDVIDFFPNEVDKRKYSRIRLSINRDDLMINSIKEFDKNGNNFTIFITKFKPNIPLDDNFFTFDKANHPDVEFVDMRE